MDFALCFAQLGILIIGFDELHGSNLNPDSDSSEETQP